MNPISPTSYDIPKEGLAHAVSDPRCRYIRYHDGFEEPYDHQQEPHEFTNLATTPASTNIKAKLTKGLPLSPAASREIPKDSIYKGKKNQHARIQSKPSHHATLQHPQTRLLRPLHLAWSEQ